MKMDIVPNAICSPNEEEYILLWRTIKNVPSKSIIFLYQILFYSESYGSSALNF